jgi:hypothetical protein
VFYESLSDFVSSKDMQEYLDYKDLREWNLCELIYFAPASVEAKLDFFKKLQAAEDDDRSSEDNLMAQYITNLEDGLKEMSGEGIFTITNGFFDEKGKDTDYVDVNICTTFEAAMKCVKENFSGCKYASDDLIWYEIEKRIPIEDGMTRIICTYTIVNGELWYIDMESDYYEDHMMAIGYFGRDNLNLAVPFLPGDIAKVDGFPYGPKYRMMIVSVGDNRDCCCLQGLAKNEDGKWTVGAVKHGDVGYHYYPKISPLYSAEKTDELFGEDEEVWSKIKEYVAGDQSKAEKFYDCDALCANGVTDEEMLVLISADFQDEVKI